MSNSALAHELAKIKDSLEEEFLYLAEYLAHVRLILCFRLKQINDRCKAIYPSLNETERTQLIDAARFYVVNQLLLREMTDLGYQVSFDANEWSEYILQRAYD